MSMELYTLIGGILGLAVLAAYWKGKTDGYNERYAQEKQEETTKNWEAYFSKLKGDENG